MVSARSETGMMATRYYYALGRSTGYAINGTRQTTIAYDANNQLLQVRNATPTNVISQFDYTYDAAGRRVSIAKSGSAFGDLSGSVDTYTYNARSELTLARRTKNGQPIPGFSEDFDYDPIGNRRSSATYNEKGEAQTSTYQANNLNQYTSRTTPGYAAVRGEADLNAFVSINGNEAYRLGSYYFGSDLFDNTAAGGLANLETYATLGQFVANGDEAEDLVSATTNQVYLAQSPETFAYDDDGNQTLITTKTGLWRVTYNGENRPICWVRDSDNTTLAMTYDHMGRRREKNGQRFFYDGYLQTCNLDSTTTTSNYNYFAWDCTEIVATRPLAWLRADFSGFYTQDGNKNVSEVITMNDGLVAHYEYAPFGAIIALCGERVGANPWRFSSEFADDELGCDYYNYREYEPVSGRWLQRDPLEYDCVNLYVYCYNRFTGCIDRLGRESSLLDALSWEVNYCCLNGNVICRDPVDTGVTVHKLYDRDWYEWGARIIRPFTPNQRKLTHAWFEVVGDCEIFTFGAYPNTDARMGVISPDPHAPDSSNPNTQSETIKLSPCDYDIAAFTTCVLSAKDEYFDWTFWSNCGDFVDGTVARCKSASERK